MAFPSKHKIVIFGFLFFSIFLGIKSYSRGLLNEDSISIINFCNSAKENVLDYQKSMDFINYAKKIESKSDCKLCKGEILYTKALIYSKHNLNDSALYYYNGAFKVFESEKYFGRALETIKLIIVIHNKNYEYSKSIDLIKTGLGLGDSNELAKLRADLYLKLGSAYDNIGLYKKSTEALINALEMYELVKDSSGICSSLINLGSIFMVDKNYNDAYEYTNRALEIAIILDDKYSISACLNNIGTIYSYSDRPKEALEFFKRSLEIDSKLGDKYGIAICLNNIGDTYKDLGDTVLAISYYYKSLDVARPDYVQMISIVLYNLGELNMIQGNLKEALRLANECLEAANLSYLSEDILSSYELLHRIYSEMGRYEDAYYYLNKREKLRDSTFTLSKSQYIQDVKAKYNDEQQKSEISTLKEQNIDESETKRYLLITILAISILIVSMFVFNSIIRRSRRLVRKQKVYYEKLLEYSEDYISVVDKDGIIKYVSPSYERGLGWHINSRIGKSTFENIHVDDVSFIKNEFRNLLVDKRPRNVTFRIKDSFDNWLTVYAFGQNLLNDPTINGIVINFWDITKIKKNEELISQSEVKFREIFNAFPDIYFQTNIKGIITEISPSVQELIGYSREELIGISHYEYNHFIADWKKIAARFESNTKISDHDTQIKTKSGKIIHCSFSAEYMYDSNNNRSGIKGVIRDITGRIRNQRKLHESQLKLKEANRAKEKIFSIIAHDLIGPIGTNKSIVDLIVNQLNELSHDEIVSLITSLKPSLDSTYSLIENLLSWARIQQNKIVPNIENVSINRILSSIGEVLISQAGRKSIELEIYKGRDISILGDQNQLDIIFRNIISNAIKFSNKDSKVKVDVQRLDTTAEISITDNGIGMGKKQITTILSGKGTDKSRKGTDNEKGTGFGLVIVGEFIKNNKGSIDIISKEGKGTTFIITLPLGS